MENIINLVKNNLVIVILIILIILDSCKSKKRPTKPIERFTNSNKIGFCSDGIGGKVLENVTQEKCFTRAKNKKKYKNKKLIINDKVKKELVHKDNIKKKEYFYGKNTYAKCKQWIDDPNKKDPSVECLQAIWDTSGCNYMKQKKTNFTISNNFEALYLDAQYYYARGCIESGVKTEKATELVKDIEDKINKSLYVSKNKLVMGEIEDEVIRNIINVKDKSEDKVVTGNEGLSSKTSGDTKKYLNFDVYLLEIISGYNKALRNGVDKNKAKNILIEDYNSFKKDGTVANLIGKQNVEVFENEIKKATGVDLNVKEGFDGVDYDKKGRLREHQRSLSSCYLITALVKAKLLSIGQVYQLRKLMLEAFKVVTNRPFFSFYYDNFGPIANMLVKENRLSEILPNMLKCIDLSKNGQFDLAFEQYIFTARQAYQICKDMGMDTKDLEDKFEKLDGTISELPEPNNLFVENGFREAIKSC